MISNSSSARRISEPLHPALLAAIVLAFFALYWASSFSIASRNATTYFGADTWQYSELAKGNFNDRILRLHPITIGLALGWMKVFSPLAAWIAPIAILKALFALIGAVGVAAAASAFSRFMSWRDAILWSAVYGSSMSVWYFSTIEESKIVSATLVAVYIAIYLHLREEWSPKRALLLTAIFFLACLNEIVAALLVAIPAIDLFFKNYFRLRAYVWLALHALAAPLALLVLEFGIRRNVVAKATAEGTSFVEIFMWYFSQNVYNLKTLNDFLLRWFFFNIAAPDAEVNFADVKTGYGGDFETIFSRYFESPVSAAIVFLFAVIVVVIVWLRRSGPDIRGLMLALAAYALVRMAFFFAFLPYECLLYSSSVTLVHLLLLAIPFMASSFRHKTATLSALAVALFVNNAIFIFTAQTIPLAQ